MLVDSGFQAPLENVDNIFLKNFKRLTPCKFKWRVHWVTGFAVRGIRTEQSEQRTVQFSKPDEQPSEQPEHLTVSIILTAQTVGIARTAVMIRDWNFPGLSLLTIADDFEKNGPEGPNRAVTDQFGPRSTNTDREWPSLIKKDQTGPWLTNLDQKGSKRTVRTNLDPKGP